MSIKFKAIFSLMMLVSIIAGFLFYVFLQNHQERLASLLTEKENLINVAFELIVNKEMKHYRSRVLSFINSKPEVMAALRNGRRQDLYRNVLPAYKLFQSENEYFERIHYYLPDGRLFLQMEEPPSETDSGQWEPCDSGIVKDAIQQGRQMSGFDIDRSGVFYKIVSPVVDGELCVGWVEFATRFEDFIGIPRRLAGTNVAIALSGVKDIYVSGFKEAATRHGDSLLLSSANDIFQKLPPSIKLETASQMVAMDGRTYMLYCKHEICDYRGYQIGRLVVLNDISDLTNEFRRRLASVGLSVLLIMAAAFVVLNYSFDAILKKVFIGEANLRAIFDNANVALVMTDAKGRIVQSNAKFKEMAGLAAGNLKGRDFLYDLIHPDERDFLFISLERLSSGISDICRFEKRMLREDGSVKWMDTSLSAVRNDKRQIECIIGVSVDITDIKGKTEELSWSLRALRMSDECAKALASESSESAYLKAVCRMFLGKGGFSHAAFIASGKSQIEPPRLLACDGTFDCPEESLKADMLRVNALDRLPAQGPPEIMDAASLPHGHARTLLEHAKGDAVRTASSVPLPVEAPAGAFILLSSGDPADPAKERELLSKLADDIANGVRSFRNKREKEETKSELAKSRESLIQADKMASLGILSAGIAHEINNPNNSVMINAPLVAKSWSSVEPILKAYHEENGDFSVAGIPYSRMTKLMPSILSGMQEASKRIAKIVAGLKGYARQDVNNRMEPVNVNSIVREAADLLDAMIRKSTTELELRLEEKIPFVMCNYQKIEQVIINLLQNSCQALPSKSCAIRVSTGFDRKSEMVFIKVEDEGVGISESNLPHVTDPFFTTKRESGGTGLGLSISAGILKDHGGRLEIESAEGEGTAATALLPVCGKPDSWETMYL